MEEIVQAIIIGIVAVTTTMTAFNGMQSAFRQSASAVGADVIYVSRMPWIMMNDWFLYRNRPTVTVDQAEQLREDIRRFQRENDLDRVVMVWCASTEAYRELTAVHQQFIHILELRVWKEDAIAERIAEAAEK